MRKQRDHRHFDFKRPHPRTSGWTGATGLKPERYLLVRVQEEAVPDGAEPRGGQHAAPLSGRGGAGAAEQRHDAPHEHHGVVKSEKETVRKESWQYLECHKQVLTRHYNFLFLCLYDRWRFT